MSPKTAKDQQLNELCGGKFLAVDEGVRRQNKQAE